MKIRGRYPQQQSGGSHSEEQRLLFGTKAGSTKFKELSRRGYGPPFGVVTDASAERQLYSCFILIAKFAMCRSIHTASHGDRNGSNLW